MLLVVDSNRPEQAKELEAFYTAFVVDNNLTTRQCLVMAVNISGGGAALGNWHGTLHLDHFIS